MGLMRRHRFEKFIIVLVSFDLIVAGHCCRWFHVLESAKDNPWVENRGEKASAAQRGAGVGVAGEGREGTPRSKGRGREEAITAGGGMDGAARTASQRV